MKKLIAALLVLFSCSASFAASGETGGLASLAFFKFDQETEGPSIGNTKSANTFYDLKAGYVFSNGIYGGVLYSVRNSDDGIIQPKRTLYAVSLGFHRSGFFVDLSYILGGSWDYGTTEFDKASGVAADLGYVYMTGSNFFVGAEFSYKSINFKEYTSGNTTLTQDNKVKSELYPMLVGGVMF